MAGTTGEIIAGRYEVLRALGRGGIGKVFLVQDREAGELRALKMLRSKYQKSDRALKRFEREVSATQKIDHPCVVKIFDVVQTDKHTFYTMEYIEGKTVRKWMKQRGQLDFGSVVRILSLAAHGLEAAHKHTIHRDISPENIMVLRDGSIRILDFGLAKLEDVHSNLTMVGVSLGKMAYMSPEQRVSATEVDLRADIYPLGVMFYEMLTGDLPRYTTTFSELRPDLPPECQEFLDRAMAEEPEDRFSDMQEFRYALRDLYEVYKGQEVDPDTTTLRVPKESARRQASAKRPMAMPPQEEPQNVFARIAQRFAGLFGRK